MSLSKPPSKLNELDHLILYSILLKRSNKATIPEMRDVVESFWKKHNLKFTRTQLSIPSTTYFYQRLDRMVDIGYLIKHGKRAYRLNLQDHTYIQEYIIGYIKFTYGVGDHV